MKLLLRLLAVAALVGPSPAWGAAVALPIDGYWERQTVKGFGTNVTAEFHAQRRALFPNNGLPNQFTGIHAGVDIEYNQPSDVGIPIPIRAAADGEVVTVTMAAGYGGVIVVRHQAPESVTTLYGHLRLADRRVNPGDRVAAGQTLAFLGESFTVDTSGARKHLHFSVHKGPAAELAGHVSSAAALEAGWYNPNDWLARYDTRLTPSPPPTVVPTPLPSPAAASRGWFDRLIDWIGSLLT